MGSCYKYRRSFTHSLPLTSYSAAPFLSRPDWNQPMAQGLGMPALEPAGAVHGRGRESRGDGPGGSGVTWGCLPLCYAMSFPLCRFLKACSALLWGVPFEPLQNV